MPKTPKIKKSVGNRRIDQKPINQAPKLNIRPDKSNQKTYKIHQVVLPSKVGEKKVRIYIKRPKNNGGAPKVNLLFSPEALPSQKQSYTITLTPHEADQTLLMGEFIIDDNLTNVFGAKRKGESGFFKHKSIPWEGETLTLTVSLNEDLNNKKLLSSKTYSFVIPRRMTFALMGDSYAAGLGTGTYDLSDPIYEKGAYRSSTSGFERFIRDLKEDYRIDYINTTYAGAQLLSGNEDDYIGNEQDVIQDWLSKESKLDESIRSEILTLFNSLDTTPISKDKIIKTLSKLQNKTRGKTKRHLKNLIETLQDQVSSIIRITNYDMLEENFDTHIYTEEGSQLNAVSIWLKNRPLDYMILGAGGNDMYENSKGESGLTSLVKRILTNVGELNDPIVFFNALMRLLNPSTATVDSLTPLRSAFEIAINAVERDQTKIERGLATLLIANTVLFKYMENISHYKDTKVILNTYPDLTKDSYGDYSDIANLTSKNELKYAYDNVFNPLNQIIIKFSTLFNNVHVNNVMDINPGIKYHGLAAKDPWFHYLFDNDLIPQPEKNRPGFSASFHPTAEGQYQSYYKTLKKTFKKIHTKMPIYQQKIELNGTQTAENLTTPFSVSSSS